MAPQPHLAFADSGFQGSADSRASVLAAHLPMSAVRSLGVLDHGSGIPSCWSPWKYSMGDSTVTVPEARNCCQPGPLCTSFLSILGGAVTLPFLRTQALCGPTRGWRNPSRTPRGPPILRFPPTLNLPVAIPVPKEGFAPTFNIQ